MTNVADQQKLEEKLNAIKYLRDIERRIFNESISFKELKDANGSLLGHKPKTGSIFKNWSLLRETLIKTGFEYELDKSFMSFDFDENLEEEKYKTEKLSLIFANQRHLHSELISENNSPITFPLTQALELCTSLIENGKMMEDMEVIIPLTSRVDKKKIMFRCQFDGQKYCLLFTPYLTSHFTEAETLAVFSLYY